MTRLRSKLAKVLLDWLHMPSLAVRFYYLQQRLGAADRDFLATLVSRLSRIFTSVEIEVGAQIGPGMIILHGVGLTITAFAVIGERCQLMQGVTVGAIWMPEENRFGAPRIGDDVKIFSGAQVLGDVHVGDGAYIGANAVVLKDVPAGATAVGVPARVIPGPHPLR